MAERDEPLLYGELREMIQRIDERISNLDRNFINAITDIRADMRQMRNCLIGLYMFIIAVATAAITVAKMIG